MIQHILKKSLPHLVAIICFVVVSLVYFSPALEGMALRQHDVDKHKGMSREIMDWRQYYGEEPLWTDAQFGGMPATQISVIYKDNLLNYLQDVFTLWLPHPAKLLFLYMIGFYIMLMCMKVDPWLALAGSLAYGFSSYFFTIIGAGHNSKAWAVGYMAPVFGAFVMTLREKKNWWHGAILTALFFGLQLKANHIQITYYLGILLIYTGLYFFIKAIKDKEFILFGKKTAALALAVGLGAMANMSNLVGTAEYSKLTQRGGSELTINPDGTPREITGGLDKNYITSWSYGRAETWSFFIPGAQGYWSMRVNGGMPTAVKDNLAEKFGTDQIASFVTATTSPYWGAQGGTYGTTYIGAVVCFLAFLGMFLMKSQIKWVLFAMTVLAVQLAWGKHLMGLTEFFLDYIPLYNKFRAVTIILVMVEFTLPLLGVLWLSELFKEKNPLQGTTTFFRKLKVDTRKLFFGLSGFVAVLLLLFLAAPESFFNFLKEGETDQMRAQLAGQGLEGAQLEQIHSQAMGVLKSGRISIFTGDVIRTLIFVILTFALLFVYMRGLLKRIPVILGIGLLALIDLWGVATIYLDNSDVKDPRYYGYSGYEYWQPEEEKLYPFIASGADNAIFDYELAANPALKEEVIALTNSRLSESEQATGRVKDRIRFGVLNEKTSYRVLTMDNPFNSSDLAYFHKSVGGYHAAKVQRFQDIIDFYLYKTDTSGRKIAPDCELLLAQNPTTLAQANVLNMLNTKYVIINPEGQGLVDISNPATMANQNPAAFVNPYAMGNAWFVNDFQIADDANQAIGGLKDLKISESAIVEKEFADKLPPSSTPDSLAVIKLVKYAPNHLEYEVNSLNQDKLAVFSEVYYPIGWSAEADGKEVQIIPVNYFLRGIVVPAGTEKVTMHYYPESFGWSSKVSLAGSGIILLLAGFLIFSVVKSSRTENGEA